MLAVRGRAVARLTAVVMASGLVVTGTAAATASASVADGSAPGEGGAAATLRGLQADASGQAVVREGGAGRTVQAGLFRMDVDDGGTLQTYSVDMDNPARTEARYQETPWRGTSLAANPDAGKIRWILQNSYPQVNDLDVLAKKAGLTGQLTNGTAAAGTQVAIWRYSDHVRVEAVDPQAERLADWLEKKAKKLAEPRASLALDPSVVSGRPGRRIGPVTVRTSADRVTVTPSDDPSVTGVRIVDQAGAEITGDVKDGSRLYFDVPADALDGTAALTVQATTPVPVGRALSGESHSQTQILAGSSDSTVTAAATTNWSKQGAAPAVTEAKDCAGGGVDITARNNGDKPFTFELLGVEYTIAPGVSRTVTAPVTEDQAYDLTVTGPDRFEKAFQGVLDCRTAGTSAPAQEQFTTMLAPTTAGGASAGATGTTGSMSAGTDLAETGASGATPMIVGLAGVFVALGAAGVLLLRKKSH
ncbi:TQXA domain-containing protein [Streptomyces sannanensis]|uniref:TQXA domain-containing protein n=1 Tax=Streptomyces sannanensis TaxID=285536 RepID=A0ABP6S9S5_9ACTN